MDEVIKVVSNPLGLGSLEDRDIWTYEGCVHTEERPYEDRRVGGDLRAQERGLGRTLTCGHVDLELLASRTGRGFIAVVRGDPAVLFCHGRCSSRARQAVASPGDSPF